jgi:hypothetical protein
MPISNFLFVEVQQTGKVPAQRDVRTAIQKHVMRDIGNGRRGQPRPPRRSENGRDLRKPGTPSSRKIVSTICPETDPMPSARAKDLGYTGDHAKIPYLVSGGHRADPFTQFPIRMTPETYALIDYCK